MSYKCRQCGTEIHRVVWEGDWHFSWSNELCDGEDCAAQPLQEGDWERLFPVHAKRLRIEKERGTSCPACYGRHELRWNWDTTKRSCYCGYTEEV
jgi:DNA-directed RNA polymerase subunit RPC12/RpoP